MAEDGHASCSGCGTDLEPMKEAHTGPRGVEPPRTPYLCDTRDGGCGTFEFVTSAAAAHNDRNRGINPKRLQEGARIGRSYSVPSDTFRNNYDGIFRRKEFLAGVTLTPEEQMNLRMMEIQSADSESRRIGHDLGAARRSDAGVGSNSGTGTGA